MSRRTGIGDLVLAILLVPVPFAIVYAAHHLGGKEAAAWAGGLMIAAIPFSMLIAGWLDRDLKDHLKTLGIIGALVGLSIVVWLAYSH